MDTSPAVKLRGQVVLVVVLAVTALTFALYGLIGLLLAYGRAVPGELWLAAGTFGGYVGGLLVNTKHDPTAQDPAPVQVVNQTDQPIPVETTQPDDTGPDDTAEPLPVGDAAP